MDNAKRVPILLSSIGAPTYALLSDLVAPTPPSDKSFTEILAQRVGAAVVGVALVKLVSAPEQQSIRIGL